MVNDEAVEAAAAGMWEQRPMQRTTDGAPLPFHKAKAYQRTRYLHLARAALSAAAPPSLQRLRDAQAEAFDAGFTACAHEHMRQREDPSHPITRINPYVDAA